MACLRRGFEEPGDVPRAYLLLMQGGYSTGQTVVLDGGVVLV
jgi:hypothetical protein